METVPPTYLSTSPESSVLLNVEVYLKDGLEPMFVGLQSKAYQSYESTSSPISPLLWNNNSLSNWQALFICWWLHCQYLVKQTTSMTVWLASIIIHRKNCLIPVSIFAWLWKVGVYTSTVSTIKHCLDETTKGLQAEQYFLSHKAICVSKCSVLLRYSWWMGKQCGSPKPRIQISVNRYPSYV